MEISISSELEEKIKRVPQYPKFVESVLTEAIDAYIQKKETEEMPFPPHLLIKNKEEARKKILQGVKEIELGNSYTEAEFLQKMDELEKNFE